MGGGWGRVLCWVHEKVGVREGAWLGWWEVRWMEALGGGVGGENEWQPRWA